MSVFSVHLNTLIITCCSFSASTFIFLSIWKTVYRFQEIYRFFCRKHECIPAFHWTGDETETNQLMDERWTSNTAKEKRSERDHEMRKLKIQSRLCGVLLTYRLHSHLLGTSSWASGTRVGVVTPYDSITRTS